MSHGSATSKSTLCSLSAIGHTWYCFMKRLDSDTFAGLFVDAMASQLKRIAGEAIRVDASQLEQGERVRAAALRLKRTERFAAKTEREERAAYEKQVFQELLDALRGGTGDASPV